MVLSRVGKLFPALMPWIMPLLIAYFAFVLTSWLAQPLANLALRLHPFGRLALSRDERTASNWVGAFLLAALVCGTGCLFLPGKGTVYLTIYFVLMLMPLAATFHAEAPWPRKPLAIYAAVTALVGFLGVLFMALPWPDPRGQPPAVVLLLLLLGLSAIAFPLAGSGCPHLRGTY